MMNEEMKRIIEVTNELSQYDSTAGCTSEVIAAAFILNDMDKLPGYYTDVTDAWERLGSEWQGYVKQIKQDYCHLVQSAR
ncbi:hypothetical protein [Pseudoalteromonas aurantia]|nr:hypothetical protein [Pseudoalteromonas aurantia]